MLREEMMAVAAAAGQGAAERMAMAGYAKELDPKRWASFGYLEVFAGDDTGEAAVQALAAYCCSYHDAVSPEQLFLKARELGVHRFVHDWGAQHAANQLPYVAFCAAVRPVFEAIRTSVPEEVPPNPLAALEQEVDAGKLTMAQPMADAFEDETPGLDERVPGTEGVGAHAVADAEQEPPQQEPASEEPAGKKRKR